MRSGTIRFDIRTDGHADHWLLRNRRGDVEISREDIEADATIRTDRAVFDALTLGQLYYPTAVLRGDIAVSGDPTLINITKRLFPDRTGTPQRPVTAATGGEP
jgi:hypothetical protein